MARLVRKRTTTLSVAFALAFIGGMSLLQECFEDAPPRVPKPYSDPIVSPGNGTASNIWVSLSVCFSSRANRQGKKNFPYKLATKLASRLWLNRYEITGERSRLLVQPAFDIVILTRR